MNFHLIRQSKDISYANISFRRCAKVPCFHCLFGFEVEKKDGENVVSENDVAVQEVMWKS